MSLALFSPVLERVQELRIQTRQASQVLGVYLVGLALVGVDQPRLARIGYQHLVATLLLEYSANPGGVSARLYGYAQRLLRAKVSLEGLGSGSQPTLLDHLATLCVDEAQVGVFVAQIQAGCNLWLLFATITHGPILLSFGPLLKRARIAFADPQGTAYGVGLIIPSSEKSSS